MSIVALIALVFVASTVIDFAAASYDGAMQAARAGELRAAHRAGVWSVILGAVGCVGFVAVVDVSMWLIVPELLGYYCGTRLALHRACQKPCTAEVVTARCVPWHESVESTSGR